MPTYIFLCLPLHHDVVGPSLMPSPGDWHFVPLKDLPRDVISQRQQIPAAYPLETGLCGTSLSSGMRLPKDVLESKSLYKVHTMAIVGQMMSADELKVKTSEIDVPKYAGAALKATFVGIKLYLSKGNDFWWKTQQLQIRVDGKLISVIHLRLPKLPVDEVEIVLPKPYTFPAFVSSNVRVACLSNGDPIFQPPPKQFLYGFLGTRQSLSVEGAEIELIFSLEPGPVANESMLEGPLRHTYDSFKAFEMLLSDNPKLDYSIALSLQSSTILLSTAAWNALFEHVPDVPVVYLRGNIHYVCLDESTPSLDHISGPDPGITTPDQTNQLAVYITQLCEFLLAFADSLLPFDDAYESTWMPCIVRNVAEIIAHGAFIIDTHLKHLELSNTLTSIGKLMRSVDAAALLMAQIRDISGGGIGFSAIDPGLTPKSLMLRLCDKPLAALLDRPFDLGPLATVQRIRFVSCDELVQNRYLQMWEVLDYETLPQIPYSAISYVWRGIFADKPHPTSYQVSSSTFRVKGVEEDGDPISIDVLISAARASLAQGTHYMWIDRLCILQKNRDDKGWQLDKTCRLYQQCKRCIIVPNGLLSLASPEKSSPWLSRMWTLEEGLIPADSQVLFSWTYGPGFLVRGGHAHGGSLIGYVDEIEDGVGMLPLLFLTRQRFGTKASFHDRGGNYKADVVFNLLGDGQLDDDSDDGGLSLFSRAADSFRPQGDAAATWRKERDRALWYSALVRRATNRDDIILILSGLLGLKQLDDPPIRGKRCPVLDNSQIENLALALDMYPFFIDGCSSQTLRDARRMMYDLRYRYKTDTIRPPLPFLLPYKEVYSPPPSHSCLDIPDTSTSSALVQNLSSISSLSPKTTIETLHPSSNVSMTDAYAAIRILSLRGVPSTATDMFLNPLLSMEALLSLLKCLTNLRDVELRGWTLDDTLPSNSPPTRPIALHRLKFVDIHPAQHSHTASALLSLFDADLLCIHGPPFIEPASSLRPVFNVPSLQPNFIDGVRDIYMHCNADTMAVWLRALVKSPSSINNEVVPDGGSSRVSTLRKVDVICDDMCAAYVLSDFLRTGAAHSVEHLSIDLSQYCIKHQSMHPQEFLSEILQHQPHPLQILTIRLHFVIDSAMDHNIHFDDFDDTRLAIIFTCRHMCDCLGAILRYAPASLKTLNLEIDLVPLSPDDEIQFTTESVLRSIASFHFLLNFSDHMGRWWPTLSSLEHVNFVWRRLACSHRGCMIEAEDLVTEFLPAVQKYHSQPPYESLLDEELSKANALVRDLVKSGFITSRWDTYERK